MASAPSQGGKVFCFIKKQTEKRQVRGPCTLRRPEASALWGLGWATCVTEPEGRRCPQGEGLTGQPLGGLLPPASAQAVLSGPQGT